MLPMLIGHAPVDHRDRLDAMFRELLIDGNTFLSGFAHQVSPQLRGRDRGARLRAIAALANDSQDYLIVVGTLHLVGEDSVLSMLARDGLKTRPVQTR